MTSTYPLLESVDVPGDLRRLPEGELPELAAELRSFLIDSVSRSGGHLASGLGTVELSVALHYDFNTPDDAIVWDVGHQCYPHKVLTGRRTLMKSIRRRGGLSGFLRRDESVYDAFGAGHSSTSISAALGMAAANARQGLDRRSVAVIGDGALTAGLAFEALDHAGATDADLVVILNDNRMSISPNVGALNDYLDGLATGGGHGRWFEDLGFEYYGPVDGHDLPRLLETLRTVEAKRGPRLVHVLTKKGYGYDRAEAEPIKYHGVTPFDPGVGIVAPTVKPAPTYTQLFGDWLCDAAKADERVVAVTPAMREGSGLVRFAKEHPDRYHDVGIAEQHAVTFAAGLAANGLRPVVAIYSSFLQRAYDQLIHDVALQQLPVVFAIDRAGLVGPDGATHNGSMDLSFLRCVPNLVVMAPADGSDLRDMLQTGLSIDGPSAIRYPRATLVPPPDRPAKALPLGVSEVRRKGSRVAILVFGTLLDTALEVAEEIGATVVNMRFVKPLDVRRVFDIARSHELIVTLEENAVTGGAGSAVGECLAARNLRTPLLQIGLSDDFTEHGTREEVLKDAGLDRAGILATIERQRAMLAARTTVAVAIGSATLSVALAAGRLLSTLGPAPPGRRLGDVRDGVDPG